MFCDRVLALLDGDMLIIPRIDNDFLLSHVFHVTKLARTNRYADDDCEGPSDRIPFVRRSLKRLCNDVFFSARGDNGNGGGGGGGGCVVDLWLRRKTYGIDAEKERPVEEAAVFRILAASPDELLQLHPDAWIDVIEDLVRNMLEEQEAGAEEGAEAEEEEEEGRGGGRRVTPSPFAVHKVAYMPAHEFAYPRSVRDAILSEAASVSRDAGYNDDVVAGGVLTVSLFVPGTTDSSKWALNYDADGMTGEPLTASERFLAARFRVCADQAVAVGVGELMLTVRLVHDASASCDDVFVLRYVVAEDTVTRLPPEDARAIIARNEDGLLHARHVLRVL